MWTAIALFINVITIPLGLRDSRPTSKNPPGHFLSKDSKMTFSRKFNNPLAVLALLSTGYALSFFQRVSPSVLAPDLMNAFSLDAASFSLISSATMLGYAVTQLPSGFLADIFGGRRTLAAYQMLAGIFCILFTLCSSFVPAVACRFLLGLTLASNVPSYKLLAASVPPNRYALYCSVLTGCGTIGTLMAASPLVAASHMAGWRAALLAVGIFTVFLGLAIWLLVPDYDLGTEHSGASLRANVGALCKGLGEIVKMRNFWLIFVWFMFMIGNMFVLLTTWWGSYLMQANGLSKDAAGLSMSVMSFLQLPFMLVFPWLSDNVFHSRRLFLMISSIVQMSVLLFICFHGPEQLSFISLTFLGTLFIVFTNCMGPISFTMVKESVPSSALASATGFINSSAPVLAAIVQGIFGTIVTAMLNDGALPQQAFSMAFLLLLAGSFIALGTTFFMIDTLKKKTGG